MLQIAVVAVFAQRHEPVNPQKDKIYYQGYLIRLMPAHGPGYGYDIFKGKELMVHQSYNPFTRSHMDLIKKTMRIK